MAGFAELHLDGAMGAVLQSLGFDAEAADVRETVPTAARGHNLVVVAPPTAVHALPALAGGLSHAARDGSGLRALVLAPPAALPGLEHALVPLARAAGLVPCTAATPTRAARHLRDDTPGLLLTTPDNALALLERAALRPAALRSVVLAWPEQYADRPSLAPVMAEVPKDAQRLVLTGDLAGVAALVERYARRAPVVGAPAEGAPTASAGPVRTVSVTDATRGAALRAVLEVLDPDTATVWVANEGSAAEARADLASAGPHVRVGTAAPGSGLVIAYDVPTPRTLLELVAGGEVVLLVPPQAEAWVAAHTTGRRPLRIGDALDQVRDAAAGRRAQLAERLDRGVPAAALYELAPLLERWGAVEVAAAAYDLWCARPTAAAPAPVVMPVSETGKMWVGIGAMDKVTPNDLVAALVKDLKLDRSRIGKIDIREKFSLVELPAADVERVAAALTGKSIRRRRVVARADRGATARTPRPRS